MAIGCPPRSCCPSKPWFSLAWLVFQVYLCRCFLELPWYTPGATNIAGWEIHHEWRCIFNKQWWFSIAMLVYQRVEKNTNKTRKFLVGNPMFFFLEVCWEIYVVLQMFVCENSVSWNILMWLMFGVSSNFLVPMLVKRQNNIFLAKFGGKNMGHLLPWILMRILRITSLKWENLEVTPCLRLVEESWNIPKDGISQIPNISTICFPPRLVEIPQTVTCRLWRIVTPRNISRSPPCDEML